MHFRSQQSHFAERDCNMPVPQDASIASSFPGLQLLVPKSNRIKPVRLQEIRSFLIHHCNISFRANHFLNGPPRCLTYPKLSSSTCRTLYSHTMN
ncbi:hypothetical protein CEXT_569731 [Caerostris extrusa]|uniref:Uncharacterized protein n=1 Tax=Caerostris extrusa TaxID=172846 RepID=A0AAV4XC59_CAEEX|nr:hypothetical protein CEXT_569731 [Caerostris extrusa]